MKSEKPSPIMKFNAFRGVNNQLDPTRILTERAGIFVVPPTKNLIFDNSGMARSRPGRVIRIEGDFHDVWSDPPFLYVRQGNLLKRCDVNTWTLSTLTTLGTTRRIRYASVKGATYFTNGSDIAKIRDGVYLPLSNPYPSLSYMATMPPGQIIAAYRGRLYVAQGNLLYVSEPFVYDVYDQRKGVIALSGYITMVRPVNAGIYVSYDNKVFLLQGDKPSEMKHEMKSNYGAIFGTDLTVDAEKITLAKLKLSGKPAVWLSPAGFFVGTEEGILINMTEGVYRPDIVASGAAAYYDADGFNHIVVSLTN